MRVFNELQGTAYDELTAPYEKFLPEYFGKLGEAYKTYPEANENEEYNLYVCYNKWPIRKLEYSYVISKMQEAVFKGARVLDAGCGVSSMPFLWSEFGGDVVAVDFDEKSIALMDKFDKDAFFGEARHISTMTCDIMSLPYESNSFDVVVSISVLEHLPYPNYLLAINELYRVLKPGGTLICTCDLDASREPKRRAVGAFSANDLKKILSEFKGELVQEELDADRLSITEEEIEQFWLQHYYEGIGYEGNRGYVAAGFRIKKSGMGDKKQQLLKYDELIQELIHYESTVMDLKKDLQKVNEYAGELELERDKLLTDLERISEESSQRLEQVKHVSKESEQRLKQLEEISEESEQRLRQLIETSKENEQRLKQLEEVSKESEQRLKQLKEVSKESEQRLHQIEKAAAELEHAQSSLNMLKEEYAEKFDLLAEDKKQCLQNLEIVTEENEKRLEAIEYLKMQLEKKEKVIQNMAKENKNGELNVS